jgi:hypothetical protein
MHKKTSYIDAGRVFGVIVVTLIAILLEVATFTAPNVDFAGALLCTGFIIAVWSAVFATIVGWLK